MHCDLFLDLLCSPDLGTTRTWILQLNFAQRPIFQAWSSLTNLKSQTRDPQLKVPPGGLVLNIFTTWKKPSTSDWFEPANLWSRSETVPWDHRDRLFRHFSAIPDKCTCPMFMQSKERWKPLGGLQNYALTIWKQVLRDGSGLFLSTSIRYTRDIAKMIWDVGETFHVEKVNKSSLSGWVEFHVLSLITSRYVGGSACLFL